MCRSMCVYVYVCVQDCVCVCVCINITIEGRKWLQLSELVSWKHLGLWGVFYKDFIEKYSQILIRLGLETGKAFSFCFSQVVKRLILWLDYYIFRLPFQCVLVQVGWSYSAHYYLTFICSQIPQTPENTQKNMCCHGNQLGSYPRTLVFSVNLGCPALYWNPKI